MWYNSYIIGQFGNFFVIQKNRNPPANSGEILYLESQLNLLVKLCLGDNRRVIEALMKAPGMSEGSDSIGIQVTFAHVMAVLNAVEVHPRIKTIYVELLQGYHNIPTNLTT